MSLTEDLTPDKTPPKSRQTHIDSDQQGATVTNALFETPAPTSKDWGFVFERFGLDPSEFEIIDDTVSMSSWDSGSRTMYSFRARFKRVPGSRLPDLEVEQRRQDLKAWKPSPVPVDRRPKKSVSEVITLADLQSGSGEGGGVEALTQRIHRAFDQLDDKLSKLRRERHLHSLVLSNLGDMVEGCFAAETMVPTRYGSRRIDELAAEGSATVRTTYGSWVEAEFKSFGVQPLRKITLERGGHRKVIHATPSHRWLRRRGNNRVELYTDQLEPGYYLAEAFGGGGSRAKISTFGVAHGIVFGDGHLDGHGGARLNLYGEKAALGCFMNGMEPEGPYEREEFQQPYVTYSRLPGYFKSAPSLESGTPYLLGFLAGYMATDGTVGKTVSISSAKREHLELVQDIAFILGIGTNPIREHRRVGINGVESSLYMVTLLRSTIPEELFVRDDQLQAFRDGGGKAPIEHFDGVRAKARCWRVVSVEETDRVEEVYCAVVPETQAFVIEGNILTGNCSGWYPGQLFSVELDHRGQFNYALDMLEMFSKHFFPMAEHGHMVTALSNHGEMGRLGSNKSQTGDHDNWDGVLAETLQRILRENRHFDHVEFHIPEDEMVTYAEVQGVKLGFLHGHKVKGSDANGFTKWLEAQARGDRNAWEVEIWNMAHRHNFQAWDIGSAFAFQFPSIDGGSKWLRDTTGKFSRPGLVSYTVNPEVPLRWEDLMFAGGMPND